jgi:hypothetical protein
MDDMTLKLKEFFGWLIEHYIAALTENIELKKELDDAKKEILFLTNND